MMMSDDAALLIFYVEEIVEGFLINSGKKDSNTDDKKLPLERKAHV